MNRLNIVDMFCGGGGESTGLIEAAHDYNFDINMSAINHWERAIETHSKNYPFAEHQSLQENEYIHFFQKFYSITKGIIDRLQFTNGIMLRAPTKDGSIAYICASQMGG